MAAARTQGKRAQHGKPQSAVRDDPTRSPRDRQPFRVETRIARLQAVPDEIDQALLLLVGIGQVDAANHIRGTVLRHDAENEVAARCVGERADVSEKLALIVTLVLAPDKAPRGHMIVMVDLPGGSFVADPGPGGLGCRTPIPLDGTPDEESGETNHIVFDGRRRMLKIESGERTLDAWTSGLDEDNWVDFEVANHWFSTHPASPMRQRLMLRAMTPEGRVTVMNRDVIPSGD